MNDDEHAALRDTMRARYARHYAEGARTTDENPAEPESRGNDPASTPDSSATRADPPDKGMKPETGHRDMDNPDIKPSDTW